MVFQNKSSLWAVLRMTGLVTGLLLGVSCTTPASESSAKDNWKEEAQFLALDEGRFYLLPLNNPSKVPADMAFHMSEADLIAGIEVNGQRRAYPLWILVAYHVVNDTLDDSLQSCYHTVRPAVELPLSARSWTHSRENL